MSIRNLPFGSSRCCRHNHQKGRCLWGRGRASVQQRELPPFSLATPLFVTLQSLRRALEIQTACSRWLHFVSAIPVGGHRK
jgi:hypothetical protein